MSAKPNPGRTTAAARGEIVVLLIGMRINHLWAVHRWLPVFFAMPRMMRELIRDRSLGLLHHVLLTGSPRTYYLVQYWESKEKLYAYASAPECFHHRMWAKINRREGRKGTRCHVGLWHETYIVPEGSYEAVYADMPPYGLAAAGGVLPVTARGRRAADRLSYRARRPDPVVPETTAPATSGAGRAPAET
ncbi:DUF4188 domain-containing protein [Streptomyces sp. NPDC097619]|uniref:DUF4188 domain-containing protein n=1 Tax=Streptomyces sp. NPDC097619 TaxID=3157228 RepID=UPI00332183A0